MILCSHVHAAHAAFGERDHEPGNGAGCERDAAELLGKLARHIVGRPPGIPAAASHPSAHQRAPDCARLAAWGQVFPVQDCQRNVCPLSFPSFCRQMASRHP